MTIMMTIDSFLVYGFFAEKEKGRQFFDGFSFSASFDPKGWLALHPFENLIHASIIQLYTVSMTSFLFILGHFQLNDIVTSLAIIIM